MNHEADILIVTVTKVETSAVIQAFKELVSNEPQFLSIEDRSYFNLGTIKNARVFLTQSQMGSGGLGASQQTVRKGIEALFPAAVIMVGIAFGMDEEKQNIGDILVSKQLRLYDLQRVGTQENKPKIVLRGDKPSASPWLVNYFEAAEHLWKGAEVCFGGILTGEKLVDNLDYRNTLHNLESEAIGGEMEGTGLYVACQDKKVDWILIKSICDWADGKKGDDKKARQAKAAKNAAKFVLTGLNLTTIDWQQRRVNFKQSSQAGEKPRLLKDENRFSQVLKIAERVLLELEIKAAGYTSLTIPSDIKIQLEDKRQEVEKLKEKIRNNR